MIVARASTSPTSSSARKGGHGYQQMTASDIVNEARREAGLTGTVKATTVQYEFFQQSGETDCAS